MSGDSHDQSKLPVSKPSKIVHIVDDSGFDGRKIKRERSDVCTENEGPNDGSGSGTSSDSGGGPDNRVQQQQCTSSSGSGPRVSNGFHGGDLLQDVLSAKFAALAHHGSPAKHDKIRLMIEDTISEDSKCRIQEIFLQVEQLKIEEKLLLYLKLPLSLSSPGGTIDPLRQPLNPLGNRYEIHQTIMWIKTHLEEDPDVSLPKQEVYDEYNMFCIRNSMKPLSTADFGKVMKQVYPRVRPRRLGTRGNSRYCYAGMRKRVKLDPPTLPAVTDTQTDEGEENISEEMLGAASTLIREWAESLLGLKFPTLSALARHLVDNLCVNTRSLAAVCILSASAESQPSTNKVSDTTPGPSAITAGGKTGKLREAQLQLQRKLQQREHIRDQKHRQLDSALQNQNKEKTVDNNKGGGGSKGSKKNKTSQSPQGTNASAGQSVPIGKLHSPAVATGRHKRVLKSSNNPCNIVSLQPNCDNIVVQLTEDAQSNSNARVATTNCTSSPKEVKSKSSRKRASLSAADTQSPEASPEKQPKTGDSQAVRSSEHSQSARLPSIQQTRKISVIPSSNLKPAKCKITHVNGDQSARNCDINLTTTCSEGSAKSNGRTSDFESSAKISVADLSTLTATNQSRPAQETTASFVDKNEKLCTIDPDALDDYLNGGNNSQEQEEELLQYFQQSSSSSSDTECNNVVTDTEQISRSDKVSQLRLILQQNLKPVGTVHPPSDSVPATNAKPSVAVEQPEIAQKHNLILPTLLNYSNQANNRRRVSFETNVIEHVQDHSNTLSNTVPQSPNTRRKIFNFTPISPGPHSPINGRASKPSSANASPFVSPRNTPVLRSRSNIQASSSRCRASQKILSRSMSCNMPCTAGKNDTFVVPSGSDLSRQLSSSQSPLSYNKQTEVQSGINVVTTTHPIGLVKKSERLQTIQSAALLPSDLAPQKQLLINYPSQENLQEIKNVYQKSQPADQEISELFTEGKQFTSDQLYYRSQSVPLHRMINPTLMSPISTQHSSTSFQSQSFNPSTSSSIAPTPVPSEFNDFGPMGPSDNNTYLLDEVDSNFISHNQHHFLIEEKEITSENITSILNILEEEGPQSLQILPEHPTEETNQELLCGLANTNLNLPSDDAIDPTAALNLPVGGILQRIIQSRSYPNTPLPLALSSYTPSYPEDSNGSRSYPSTPLHSMQPQEVYTEISEPMLSSPTLNSLNLHNDAANNDSSGSVCRNVTDLLETNFLGDVDGETDDLDPLDNFEGLQDVDGLHDVDSLTPLFNEVAEPNR